MSRMAYAFLLPFLLLFAGITSAWAETATVEVYHLPLAEAEQAVQTQLSPAGRVATLPSARLLIISDDAQHLRQAQKLLKQLDAPTAQYQINLDMQQSSVQNEQSIQTNAQLPGGWIQVSLSQQHTQSNRQKSFHLRTTAHQQASMEWGTLQPYRQRVIQWLAGYGLIAQDSVELVSLTSGFTAEVRPAQQGYVHVKITPWIRQAEHMSARGNTEMLWDLGSTQRPAAGAPNQGNIRLNGQPVQAQQNNIAIAGAATELTIRIGETVTLMSNSDEADLLNQALLSSQSSTSKQHLLMRITINN